MKLPKDLLSGNYIKPRIFLCEVDKERICQLETTNTSATLKFNSYSELSFEVGRIYNDVTSGDTKTNPHYDKIEALRLIEVDGLGYFEIQGPELISDGIKEAKNITAYSLEYTLSTKYLSNFLVNTGSHGSIEVTYAESTGDINNIKPVTLYNPSNTSLSLLHLAIKEVYGWKIGHVDVSLQTLSRSFEIDRESVYDFLMNEVCEKFNCYIIFNTIDNTINVYAESLTAKFIGDGRTNIFTISPPFSQIGTVSVDGYKTTRWQYNYATGAITLDDVPDDGSHIEVVDGSLAEWETDVFISFDNLSQEINVNYDADAIKTKLTVTYGDDGDIREVNLGLPYLTDLSYYYTVEWMGQELYDAYTAYLKKSNDAQTSYTNNSQEILKLNDQIYYEKTRLSLEYSLVQSVGPTTVGTYYVRQENSDGSFYYKEVSLPSEYNANEQYYSNVTTNVNEEKMSSLYNVLKKYFNNENEDNNSGDHTITSWKTDLDELADDFKFMETYTLNYLSTELSKVTENRIENVAAETAINNFLAEVWCELGKMPLEELYLKPYQTIKETNIKAGWAQKDNENYAYYYPVLLYIASIEAAIADRDATIKSYEDKRNVFYKNNSDISDRLTMDKNFTHKQLVKLGAFLREDELHIDDIIETSQDDLSSSFSVKQDAMESGRIELQKLCQPQLQFSMTMANIYALSEFEPIIDQFQLGNVIKVALRQDYIKQSRLMQVNINFDDFSDFSCEFGELTSLRSQSDIHADLLKNAITAGKSVATNSSYWSRGSDAATSIDLKIQQGLLDATTQIKAIDGSQGVIIDKYGIRLQAKDPITGEIDPKQGWIVNNQFLYSDDGFKSTKAVFGEYTYDDETYYGILAEALVGRLLIGSQIKLENDNATMSFDNNGLSVTNGVNSFNVNPNNSFLLSISNGSDKIFYVDDNGLLHIVGDGAGLDIHSNDSITGMESRLKVTEDEISMVVTDGEVNASIIVDAINNSSVTIDASRINITADNINLDGYVTIESLGENGATEIDGSRITTGHIQSSNYVADTSGMQINLENGTLDSAKFKIDSDGNIDATGGTIGGWKITDDSLSHYQDNTETMFLSGCGNQNTTYDVGNELRSDWMMWANRKFGVTKDGALYSISGNIGNWQISEYAISNATDITDDDTYTKSYVYLENLDGYRDANGDPRAWLGMVLYNADGTTEYPFYIRKDGLLTASNANITGTITANDGNIGGWSVSSKSLNYKVDNTTKMFLSGTGVQTLKYAVGTSGSRSDWTIWSNGKFGVLNDGTLYASDGIFSGTVTATKGVIGGCTIDGSGVLKVDSTNITSMSVTKLTAGSTGVSFTVESDQMKMKCNSGDTYLSMGNSYGINLTYLYTSGGDKFTDSILMFKASGSKYSTHLSSFAGLLSGSWYGTSELAITSDFNKKNSIALLDDRYDVLFDNLSAKSFKYNDGSSGRLHTGFISQEVGSALTLAGLDTNEFAGYVVKRDDEGNTADYYLRYGEFIALNTWQIQKAKARIEALEKKISKLEELINNE